MVTEECVFRLVAQPLCIRAQLRFDEERSEGDVIMVSVVIVLVNQREASAGLLGHITLGFGRLAQGDTHWREYRVERTPNSTVRECQGYLNHVLVGFTLPWAITGRIDIPNRHRLARLLRHVWNETSDVLNITPDDDGRFRSRRSFHISFDHQLFRNHNDATQSVWLPRPCVVQREESIFFQHAGCYGAGGAVPLPQVVPQEPIKRHAGNPASWPPK